MDFIFMLTHNDLTVENCLEIFDEIADLGIAHVGFKDIGVGPDVLDRLNRRIKAAGATSHLEVVSLSTADAERAARRAREIWPRSVALPKLPSWSYCAAACSYQRSACFMASSCRDRRR